jgi:hypothetical protein
MAACTYTKWEQPSACELSDTVSFSKEIVPVFTAYCSMSGCHSGSNPAGGLNLTASLAYQELLKSGSGYVDTVNPKYSILYATMNNPVKPMPPNGKLDECTLKMILKWIEQKAKNN